jgi:hypothetical protein
MKSLENWIARPLSLAERRLLVAALDTVCQTRADGGIGLNMLPEAGQTRHGIPRFILRGGPRDPGPSRIGAGLSMSGKTAFAAFSIRFAKLAIVTRRDRLLLLF